MCHAQRARGHNFRLNLRHVLTSRASVGNGKAIVDYRTWSGEHSTSAANNLVSSPRCFVGMLHHTLCQLTCDEHGELRRKRVLNMVLLK